MGRQAISVTHGIKETMDVLLHPKRKREVSPSVLQGRIDGPTANLLVDKEGSMERIPL